MPWQRSTAVLLAGAAALAWGTGRESAQSTTSIHTHAPKASRTATSSSAHFLYTLNGSAALRRFDLASGTLTGTLDLATKTPLIPTHGDASGSVVDGEETYGLACDSGQALLYTLAPTTGSVSAARRFKLLAFHLPNLALVGAMDVPDKNPDDQPLVHNEATGEVIVEADDHRFALSGNHLVPAPPVAPPLPGAVPGGPGLAGAWRVDLQPYKQVGFPAGSAPGVTYVTPLARSGDAVLLDYAAGGGRYTFAVAYGAAHTLVRLQLPFGAPEPGVLLAPGGRFAFAKEGQGSADREVWGPGMALLDTSTGAVVKRWSRPDLRSAIPLLLSPQGAAVLYSGTVYRFLATGHTFSTEAVSSEQTPALPFVLADK